MYFFFAALMLWGAVFVFFLIPETKNIPLESIDRLFDRRLTAHKAHKVVWAELQEEEEALRVGLTGNIEKEPHVEMTENVDSSV